MAAVLDKQDPATKNGSQVDEQIAQATSRIRAHDLAFGGLVLLALVLVYATGMICLDRYFVLPEWVRQVSLLGLVAVFAGTAYVTLVGPLRQRINPLYAARQVERTIDDAKNSVTGYVAAQQKGDLNSTVKAALASRAAKSVAEADVNRAIDHRGLVYLGAVSVAFFLALVVLFFVFRPAPFGSLMGRAFVPFSSAVIPNQTQIRLMKPDPTDPTITTGQSITVAVHLGGKVPSAAGPDRARLLIRHNTADPNYDELPMVAGETTRDFELRVPDYLVQNGFWYKVAAGDAVTDEYKVTVRSLPLFNETQVAYEYPKYLRRKPDSANGPLVSAYRGTTVTLTARTNREVRDGLMVIEPANTRVAGTVVPGKPDSLQFVFKLIEAGKYKLSFTATNGEISADTFQSTIAVEVDSAPQVVINKPEEDEVTEPANGQLKVDGKIGDDFGIDTVTLKMKIVGRLEQDLPDVPYMNGKSRSFRREKDGTWPTDLDYKVSVDFATLKKNAAGLDVQLAPDTVIEYWLEATDNCTEPKPNVGRSQPKKVRLTAPKVGEEEQKNLDSEKDKRKTEEKQHADQQQKKLANEKRDPKKGQPDAKEPEKKDGETGGEQQNQDKPKPGDKNESPEKNPADQPNKVEKQPGKPGGQPNKEPQKGENDPGKGQADQTPKEGDTPSKPNSADNTNPDKSKPDTAPPPKTADEKQIEDTAKEFEKELKDQNKTGGAGKGDPTPNEADKTEPGSTKPQPMDGMKGTGDPSEPKPEQKSPGANDPTKPMGQPDNAPASDKSKGDLKQPDDPATPKPDEKKADPKAGQKGGAAPSERQSEPLGPPPGGDKETPKEKQPAPKDPNQKQDANSGSTGKPSTQKEEDKSTGEQGGSPNPADKKDPAADAGSQNKPMPENTRGGDKPAPQPKGAPGENQRPAPGAGEGKPDKAPPAGGTKLMPKDDPMAKGEDAQPKPGDPGANEPKQPNGSDAAESKPDDPKNAPKGRKSLDKGGDKPAPNDAKKGEPNAGDGHAAEKKLDEKQLKELQDAAKNLNSTDPAKKKDAQDKLDKAIGEDKRKEMENLANDLQSNDKARRDAAEQKLENMKKELEKQAAKKDGKDSAPGKEPTPEEMAELMKKAQDLQSKDEKTRQQAQQDLDKKIGEENRKTLEEMMKNQKPSDPEQEKKTKEQLEKMAKSQSKKTDDDFTPRGPGDSPKAKGRMQDAKERADSAELLLEQFEKNQKSLQAKKGWTDEEYKQFLDGYRKRVEDLRQEAEKEALAGTKPTPPGPAATTPPGFTPGGLGGKADALSGPSGGPAGVGGPTAAPPGFEKARDIFQKGLQKKP
ncbi:hypothetical protein [Frigoriglobus tundricola]|uniref:Uncharacterized protein n=1 Tax=Frigoriglobus tundricola TaxID=2774151 RepID=A0A6M5Z5W5_9BACT|nr:hypothetical protein [Frigoriglobus tundricola]QJX00804.1 hypothetical protein FTUN_8442 [Frigoriglobus tundricola]